MTNEQIDRILSGEKPVAPSTGFAGSVLKAVLRDSSAPPPIPFPWSRAIPLLLAGALALAFALAGFAELLAAGPVTSAADPWSAAVAERILPLLNTTTGWLIAIVALTVASAALPSAIQYADESRYDGKS